MAIDQSHKSDKNLLLRRQLLQAGALGLGSALLARGALAADMV